MNFHLLLIFFIFIHKSILQTAPSLRKNSLLPIQFQLRDGESLKLQAEGLGRVYTMGTRSVDKEGNEVNVQDQVFTCAPQPFDLIVTQEKSVIFSEGGKVVKVVSTGFGIIYILFEDYKMVKISYSTSTNTFLAESIKSISTPNIAATQNPQILPFPSNPDRFLLVTDFGKVYDVKKSFEKESISEWQLRDSKMKFTKGVMWGDYMMLAQLENGIDIYTHTGSFVANYRYSNISLDLRLHSIQDIEVLNDTLFILDSVYGVIRANLFIEDRQLKIKTGQIVKGIKGGYDIEIKANSFVVLGKSLNDSYFIEEYLVEAINSTKYNLNRQLSIDFQLNGLTLTDHFIIAYGKDVSVVLESEILIDFKAAKDSSKYIFLHNAISFTKLSSTIDISKNIERIKGISIVNSGLLENSIITFDLRETPPSLNCQLTKKAEELNSYFTAEIISSNCLGVADANIFSACQSMQTFTLTSSSVESDNFFSTVNGLYLGLLYFFPSLLFLAVLPFCLWKRFYNKRMTQITTELSRIQTGNYGGGSQGVDFDKIQETNSFTESIENGK